MLYLFYSVKSIFCYLKKVANYFIIRNKIVLQKRTTNLFFFFESTAFIHCAVRTRDLLFLWLPNQTGQANSLIFIFTTHTQLRQLHRRGRYVTFI